VDVLARVRSHSHVSLAHDPLFGAAGQVLGQRNDVAAACLMWAGSVVDALDYLSDLDSTAAQEDRFATGYDAFTVDVAHARWAAGSALTAVDLCAAALGHLYLQPAGKYNDMANIRRALQKAGSSVAAGDPAPIPCWPLRSGVLAWLGRGEDRSRRRVPY
jgi:glutathione S-transferase